MKVSDHSLVTIMGFGGLAVSEPRQAMGQRNIQQRCFWWHNPTGIPSPTPRRVVYYQKLLEQSL